MRRPACLDDDDWATWTRTERYVSPCFDCEARSEWRRAALAAGRCDGRPGARPPCTVAGCDRDAVARSMCWAHLRRVYRYGHPVPTVPLRAAPSRTPA